MAREVDVNSPDAALAEALRWAASHGERLLIREDGAPLAEVVPLDGTGAKAVADQDWLPAIAGLCQHDPEFCDVLDEIVRERQRDMPRDTRFWWDSEGGGGP